MSTITRSDEPDINPATAMLQPAPGLTAFEIFLRFFVVAVGIVLGIIGALSIALSSGWISVC